MSTANQFDSFPRFHMDDELKERLDALSMTRNVSELREFGYTVIDNPAPIEFTERLRETIMRLVQETGGGGKGYAAALLVGRDPIFDEVLLNPKLMALTDLALGRGAVISQLTSSVKPQARRPGIGLGLHADQNWFPEPFPEHMQTITCCWACDEFTLEHGATMVIPKSHFHRRLPTREEMAACEGAVPIECPAGSIVVWNGETWHGSYKRTAAGERVVLHITYGRNCLRPIESYDHLADDYFEGKPDALRMILGRTGFYGTTTIERGGVKMEEFAETCLWQTPDHPLYSRD
jgi:hypothetical protein